MEFVRRFWRKKGKRIAMKNEGSQPQGLFEASNSQGIRRENSVRILRLAGSRKR
jgi:hypothetical protein